MKKEISTGAIKAQVSEKKQDLPLEWLMGSGLQSMAQGRDSTQRSLLEVLFFYFYVSVRG